MADSFVFSNFAVASLQDSVDQFSTEFEIHADDVDRFPVLVTGSKFPIILSDTEDNVEICYVTAMSADGTLDVERGREDTEAQSWMAGTIVIHAFTAASVFAGARLVPRGAWDSASTYGPGDVVVYAQISYLAVTQNQGSPPSPSSPDWQVLYQPPGTATNSLAWAGEWVSTTTYAIGAVVTRGGIVWIALAVTVGNVPQFNSAFWQPLAVSATMPTRYSGVYYTTATANNYVITGTAGKPTPPALYDEMELTVIFQAASTIATPTLQLGSNPPKPLRLRRNIDPPAASIQAGTPYEFIYLLATDEFVAKGAVVAEAVRSEITATLNAALATRDATIAALASRVATLEGWRTSSADPLLISYSGFNSVMTVRMGNAEAGINSLAVSRDQAIARLNTIEAVYVRDIDITGEVPLGYGAHVASGHIITLAPWFNGSTGVGGSQVLLRKNRGGTFQNVT